MFAVKWIAPNGSEMIYTADADVSYTPGGFAPPGQQSTTLPCVAFYTHGSHLTLDSGRVFVMNANGRTVADYALDLAAAQARLTPVSAAA